MALDPSSEPSCSTAGDESIPMVVTAAWCKKKIGFHLPLPFLHANWHGILRGF